MLQSQLRFEYDIAFTKPIHYLLNYDDFKSITEIFLIFEKRRPRRSSLVLGCNENPTKGKIGLY